jgi:hypothetical protein
MSAAFSTTSSSLPASSAGRRVGRGLAVAAVAGLLAAAAQLPASAAPGDRSAGTTTANVGVSSSITLRGLTPSFSLNGSPNSTVSQDAAVSYNVLTNNVGGYNVNVTANNDALLPNGGSTDDIPIENLQVRPTGGDTFTSLSDTGAVTLHDKVTRSAQSGDDYSDDYRVNIPFVADDVYSVTLNYVATAL